MGFRIALAVGVAAAILSARLLGSPGATPPAVAQGFPPPLPTTYYGTVTGMSSGAVVTAYVVNGSTQTRCGIGRTLRYQGSVVYVVAVAQDGQTEGCGMTGRRVQLTFKASGELLARPATSTTPWVEIGPGYEGAEFNAVVGPAPPIQPRAVMPLIAKGP